MHFSCGIEVPDSTRGLLFDLDGTLVDNMHLHIQAWVQSGSDFSIPVTEEMIVLNAGIPTRPLIEKLSKENNWSVNFHEFTQKKQRLYKEIKAADGNANRIEPIIEIAAFYFEKIPMAVGTGSSRGNAINALREAKILDWFETVVSADDVVHPKPHPEVFLKGAEIINVDPEACLVFEDGDKGIQSAVAAGIPYVDVRNFL